jgi:hypothetical protein
MPKVDSLTSTPAAGLDRRGLLAAAAPASSAVLKLRLLASAIEACGEEEEVRYEALRQRYELLSEQVLARPVRSWSDVIEIAEIAHFWAAKSLDGDLLALAENDRVPAKLIVAVLTMAKGGNHVEG